MYFGRDNNRQRSDLMKCWFVCFMMHNDDALCVWVKVFLTHSLRFCIFFIFYVLSIFFKDSDEAIGAPTSVLLTQFPSLYSGCAKSGVPINYFRAGRVSVDGIDCITDFEKLTDYSWHAIMHEFKSQVAEAQKKNPDAVR